MKRWQPLLGSMLVFLVALAPLAWAQSEAEKLITVREGTLPIILSAPHGGRMAVPNVPERKGDGITRFVKVRDENTAELTEKLAMAIEKKLGGKPYVVIANFERKYIDANRAPKSAYESDLAKPYYDAYHQALKKAHADVQARWRSGLFLDIHGQAVDADAIFRGTAHGKTVKHMTGRFGKPALTGPKSVFGVLAKKGNQVVPVIDKADDEDKRFSGGYNVRTYGSSEGGTIDAIQLELGSKFRQKKNLDQTAADIAEAVAVFAREYLPPEPLRKPGK